MDYKNSNKACNFAMLGYLKNESKIKISDNNNLLLFLSYCSDYPEIEEIDGINISSVLDRALTVIVQNNTSLEYEDSFYLTDEERILKAYNFFKDKWFVMRPKFDFDEQKQKLYISGYDVKIIGIRSEYNDNEPKYVRIASFEPITSLKMPQTATQFKRYLLNNKVVGEVSPWLNYEDQTPDGIVWIDKENDSVDLYTNIRFQTQNKEGFSYLPDEGKYIKGITLSNHSVNQDWFDNFLTVHDDDNYQGIAFVPYDIFNKYFEQSTDLNGDDLENNDVQEYIKNNFHETNSDENEQFDLDLGVNFEQEGFINLFRNNVLRMGLHYSYKDLINFHTSMESKGMVILSGLSGTGKSKIVKSYANTLGLTNKKDYGLCFIPVRPFWNDDSDLLGYADTVNNVYKPGDNNFVETLIDAQNNPDKLFIVVFDEMNLARVEHYFSQFLSVLESDESERYVQLYNDNLESRLYNGFQYPSKIKINNNILFVGTVNTDESTFKFSDKVLDRSNVITLDIQPFFEDFNDQLDGSLPIDEERWSVSQYKSLIRHNENVRLTTKEKKLLWDLHCNMNKCDKNLGIGWRTVSQIEDFIKCIPKINLGISRSEAIDLQLVQKILTKIRGSEEQVKKLLVPDNSSKINDDDSNLKIDDLLSIFDKYSDVSDFKESKKIITQKINELNTYGFTM